jgi:hypothetical protein
VETVLAILALTEACSCSSVLPHAYWTGCESYGLFQLQKNVYEIRHIPSYSRVVVQLIFNNLSPAILYTILLMLAFWGSTLRLKGEIRVKHWELSDVSANITVAILRVNMYLLPWSSYAGQECARRWVWWGWLVEWEISKCIFTMRMATEIFSETLDNSQCSMQFFPENLSSIILCEFVWIYFTLQQNTFS